MGEANSWATRSAYTNPSLRLKALIPLPIKQMRRDRLADVVRIHDCKEWSTVAKVTVNFENSLDVTRLETYQNLCAADTMHWCSKNTWRRCEISLPMGGLVGLIL